MCDERDLEIRLLEELRGKDYPLSILARYTNYKKEYELFGLQEKKI